MKAIRILVVEDNTSMVKNMVYALSRVDLEEGVRTSTVFVEYVRDAVKSLQADRFNVVSVDGSFKKEGGCEIDKEAGLTLITQLPGLLHIGATLFYSNNDHQIDRAAAMVVGGKKVEAYDKSQLNTVEWARRCVLLGRQHQNMP